MNNNENFDLGSKLIIHEEYILPIHNLMTRVKRILHYKSRKTYVIAKARYVVLKQYGVMTKVTGSTARGRPPTLLIRRLGVRPYFPHLANYYGKSVQNWREKTKAQIAYPIYLERSTMNTCMPPEVDCGTEFSRTLGTLVQLHLRRREQRPPWKIWRSKRKRSIHTGLNC